MLPEEHVEKLIVERLAVVPRDNVWVYLVDDVEHLVDCIPPVFDFLFGRVAENLDNLFKALVRPYANLVYEVVPFVKARGLDIELHPDKVVVRIIALEQAFPSGNHELLLWGNRDIQAFSVCLVLLVRPQRDLGLVEELREILVRHRPGGEEKHPVPVLHPFGHLAFLVRYDKALAGYTVFLHLHPQLGPVPVEHEPASLLLGPAERIEVLQVVVFGPVLVTVYDRGLPVAVSAFDVYDAFLRVGSLQENVHLFIGGRLSSF